MEENDLIETITKDFDNLKPRQSAYILGWKVTKNDENYFTARNGSGKRIDGSKKIMVTYLIRKRTEEFIKIATAKKCSK